MRMVDDRLWINGTRFFCVRTQHSVESTQELHVRVRGQRVLDERKVLAN